MEYYVFSVRLNDKWDRRAIVREWPLMVKRANPENKVDADSAHGALCKFAENDCRYPKYGDYVAGNAKAIELAANIKVDYIPRAHVCCGITMDD